MAFPYRLAGCVAAASAFSLCAFGQVTELASLAADGSQADYGASDASISSDGRYVAFDSYSDNLTSDVINYGYNVFVRDRETKTTELITLVPDGLPDYYDSYYPSISADGRFVAFLSDANNLTPGLNNLQHFNAFVRDRLLGTTEIVSVSMTGGDSNGDSLYPTISADGHYVAFWSYAYNLVPGDNNGWIDVFVRDRWAQTTELVSVNSAGQQADGDSYDPVISPDGRYVAFDSDADNLSPIDSHGNYQVYVRDRANKTTELVSQSLFGSGGNGSSEFPSMSLDGRYVAFFGDASDLVPGNTNHRTNVFVRDRLLGSTEKVSVDPSGNQANGDSGYPAISADGRFVAFSSYAYNLGPDDMNGYSDVYVRDRAQGLTTRVSTGRNGQETDSGSYYPVISTDGRLIAFASDATDIVRGDFNVSTDVFLWRPASPYVPVSGKVLFGSLAQGGEAPSLVALLVSLGGAYYSTQLLSIASDGTYAIELPAGKVGVSIKPSHWLRRTLALDTSQGVVTGADFALINGDATGDNQVGLGDLSWVLKNFGGSDAMADLDGSGSVGIADLGVVLRSFSLQGDP